MALTSHAFPLRTGVDAGLDYARYLLGFYVCVCVCIYAYMLVWLFVYMHVCM